MVKYIKKFENGYNNIKTNKNLINKFDYFGKSKNRIKKCTDKIVIKNFRLDIQNEEIENNKGIVFWITGLSGSVKSQ